MPHLLEAIEGVARQATHASDHEKGKQVPIHLGALPFWGRRNGPVP